MEGLLRRIGHITVRFRWFVLGGWIVAALLLNTLIPQLTDVIKRDTIPFLPDSAATMQAYRLDSTEFSGSDAQGFAIVVLEDTRGISAADETYYARLAQRLAADRSRVVFVQDYISHPEFEHMARSRDGKAIYLPVGLRDAVGSATGDAYAPWLRTVAAQGKPQAMTVHVTGDTAIISDFQASIQQSTERTAVITVLLVLIILLLIYRSPVTPLIPLATIGLALLVVRPIVALLGLHVLKVASFTDTFILAIVFGAGTDYCIFMISRFKEQMARGDGDGRAISTTVRRVGEAIICSAATVVVGGLAMLPASVSLLSTTGPAIAVAVAVTLVAGLTLTPALLAIGGQRFFWPKRDLTHAQPGRFWTAAAALIARRPVRVIGVSLLPLLALALLFPTMALTFNERTPQPPTNDSMQGLATLDRHYQPGEVLPDYLLVHANHDMRTPRDLAALDSVTQSLVRVDGVASVRSFTQPDGKRLPQASVAYEAGIIGGGLDQAHAQLQQSSGSVGQLQSGAQQFSQGASQLQSGAQQAAGATDQLGSGLAQESSGLQGLLNGATTAGNGAVSLRDGAAQLAAGLRALRAGEAQAVSGMDSVLQYFSIDPDPGCSVPPNSPTPCQDARNGLQAIDSAEKQQVLPGLDSAIGAADRIASGDGELAQGLAQIHAGLQQANAGVQQLQAGEQTFKQKLGQLAGGAAQLSGGADQLSGGVGALTGGTQALTTGLASAGSYLDGLSAQSGAAGIDTFYIPSAQLGNPQLALAARYYLSRDGHTARLLVFGRDDPFGDAAMQRVARERTAAEVALRGTPLAGSTVLLAGDAPLNADLSAYSGTDFRLVAIAVMLGVFVVLVLLLRSLVAPLYLLASVLLSYAAAMGVTTLVWQDILHLGAIDWTVGIFAFMMLVSVGADYNIFLMSRVREEVRRDPVHGIQNAVARTGAIITSAGVIFAGTFAALMASGLNNIAETGFAITCGLLLDTFIVRSFLVPAVAVVLGRWNWWPGTVDGGRAPLPAFRIARLLPSPLRPAVRRART